MDQKPQVVATASEAELDKQVAEAANAAVGTLEQAWHARMKTHHAELERWYERKRDRLELVKALLVALVRVEGSGAFSRDNSVHVIALAGKVVDQLAASTPAMPVLDGGGDAAGQTNG